VHPKARSTIGRRCAQRLISEFPKTNLGKD
jgi:hypothetical protein